MIGISFRGILTIPSYCYQTTHLASMETHVTEITRVIQLSVAPAFLLVAIGTLITILSTRLNRIVDRRRLLQDRLRELVGDSADIMRELDLLSHRSNLVYFAILSAVSGALLVCFVVAGSFIGALFAIELAKTVASLFVMAMGTMIVAWSIFLREIYIAVSTGTHKHR